MTSKVKDFLIILGTVFLVSCSTDTPEIEKPLGAYDKGVLVLNQGGFGNGNASLSFLSNDFNTLQNNIFEVVNPNVLLGDTAQDIGFYNDLAFIILNVSNKITVVNRYTMAIVATISTGLNNPRYIVFANGKGYVSNWGNGSNTSDDYIAVINLSNYTVSGNIPVIEGPEKIILANNNLYVAHLGGYGFGNKISVINPFTNAVSTTITVGDLPSSMEVVGNDMYVLCNGMPSWSGTETAGRLIQINLSTNQLTNNLVFPNMMHPSFMDIAGENLYYTIDTAVYKKLLTATTLPSNNLLDTKGQGVDGTNIYSFAIGNNKIYVGDAKNYSSNGKVYVYALSGLVEKNVTVGINPAGFYFN